MGNFLTIFRRLLPGGTQAERASPDAADAGQATNNRKEEYVSRKSSSDSSSSESSKSVASEKDQQVSSFHSAPSADSDKELARDNEEDGNVHTESGVYSGDAEGNRDALADDYEQDESTYGRQDVEAETTAATVIDDLSSGPPVIVEASTHEIAETLLENGAERAQHTATEVVEVSNAQNSDTVKEESEAGNETNEMSVDRAENSSPANDNVEHSDTVVDSPTNTETNATPLPPPEMEEHSGGTNLGDDAASEKSTHVDDTTELANDNVGGTNEPADRPLSVTESDRASPSSPAGKEETNMNEEPAAEPEQTHVEETPAPEPAAAEEPSGGGDDGGDAGGDE